MPKDEKVMDENDVFVICAMDSIERGDARAFSLSRIDEEGETKPFSIVILRTERDAYFGYVNACPHFNISLNWREPKFLNGAGDRFYCINHYAQFRIADGYCDEGVCEGHWLTPVAVRVEDGRVLAG